MGKRGDVSVDRSVEILPRLCLWFRVVLAVKAML